jgi:two-component system, OmpR family, response regulator
MRILLVDDHPPAEPLLAALRSAGYAVDTIENGSDLRDQVRAVPYSLLMLDVLDPVAAIRGLRREQCCVPVLVVSGSCGIDQRVQALDAGADDYLLKPVDRAELLARMRALLRRPPRLVAPVLRTGNTEFDVANARVSCASRTLELRLGERRLLALLMRRCGHVVPAQALEHALSDLRHELSRNAIEAKVSRLRKALQGVESGIVIETVRGIGYVLKPVPGSGGARLRMILRRKTLAEAPPANREAPCKA